MSLRNTLFSHLRLPAGPKRPLPRPDAQAAGSSPTTPDKRNAATMGTDHYFFSWRPLTPPPFTTDAGTAGSYDFPSGKANAETYTIQEGTDKLTVVLPSTDKPDVVQKRLASLAADYALIPEANRDAIHKVVVDPGANPLDAMWAKKYNMPNFVSGATGGEGTITFYHDANSLFPDTFTHETGHNVVHDATPDGWAAAAQADGDFPTSYASTTVKSGTYVEDFAESYSAFCDALSSGGDKLAGFVAAYPHRSAILAKLAFPNGAPADLQALLAQKPAAPSATAPAAQAAGAITPSASKDSSSTSPSTKS